MRAVVVDHTETKQLRAIGERLALYVRNGNKPVSRAALQAVAADLTAEYPELGQPLGDLVGRPGFRVLLPLAGQGRGTVEREALIRDAARIYLPEVTEALREVLGGFLELPETAERRTPPPEVNKSNRPVVERPKAVTTTEEQWTPPTQKRREPHRPHPGKPKKRGQSDPSLWEVGRYTGIMVCVSWILGGWIYGGRSPAVGEVVVLTALLLWTLVVWWERKGR
jgi:hypothetical protein